MADKIGVARKWIQSEPEHLITHYDVCKSKKQLAIKFGAIEMSDRELARKFEYDKKLKLK